MLSGVEYKGPRIEGNQHHDSRKCDVLNVLIFSRILNSQRLATFNYCNLCHLACCVEAFSSFHRIFARDQHCFISLFLCTLL